MNRHLYISIILRPLHGYIFEIQKDKVELIMPKNPLEYKILI